MSERTERNCNKCIHHTSGMCDSWDCEMQTVEDVKKEAVNEYAKAVVEELKKEAERWEDSGKEYGDLCEIALARGLRNAIEIVKQGGVSDDVCEWKSESDGEFIRNPHTRRTFSNEPSMKNIYCNTCGKKIKIVGD